MNACDAERIIRSLALLNISRVRAGNDLVEPCLILCII